MADLKNMRASTVTREQVNIDQGLRTYMLGVYNIMAIGLVVTAIAAYGMSILATTGDIAATNYAYQLANGRYLTDFGATLFFSPFRFVVMFAPLVAVMFLSFRIERLSTNTARLLFLAYAALVGISLSTIFMAFTQGSVVQVFLITAVMFGSLSLYGYTTQRDISGWGSFLFMGLIGLLVAMVINIFLQSDGMQFVISIIGVGIFAGLTAYDTQTIKELYLESDSNEAMGRKMIMGALQLYLDFINMFIFLLQLIGNRD